MVRTAAVGVQAELQAMAARLRQFNGLPSVQNLEVPVLSQRVEAAFGDNASGLISLILRADPKGRLYYWTPDGQILGKSDLEYYDAEIFAWATDRANASSVRIIHGWATAWRHGVRSRCRCVARRRARRTRRRTTLTACWR